MGDRAVDQRSDLDQPQEAAALRAHRDAVVTYLFDLARAAQPGPATRHRRKAAAIPPHVQWLLDSMTLSAAYVNNGRLDVVATDALARALVAPMFSSHTVDEHGRPNFARHYFLDDASRDFVDDWDGAANTTAALLRAEAGRYPWDKALRELVGELSTVSAGFRTRWAAHQVRIHHGGVKRLHQPDAGPTRADLPAAGPADVRPRGALP
ncbi:hypothetical protein ACIQVT_01740 [Streptomyces sp. NPDC100445]|uniref:MmyB family transcriptional regulator n=1 Tax=Streptomyces sp. NPDC100445 TaxID=3366102 RepID=UPI00382C3DD7